MKSAALPPTHWPRWGFYWSAVLSSTQRTPCHCKAWCKFCCFLFLFCALHVFSFYFSDWSLFWRLGDASKKQNKNLFFNCFRYKSQFKMQQCFFFTVYFRAQWFATDSQQVILSSLGMKQWKNCDSSCNQSEKCSLWERVTMWSCDQYEKEKISSTSSCPWAYSQFSHYRQCRCVAALQVSTHTWNFLILQVFSALVDFSLKCVI